MTQHILLVDDSIDVHLLIGASLRRCKRKDVTIESCQDPREASSLVAARTPDLLICDVNMPHLTGPELIGQLRDEGYTNPALLISSVPHHPEQAAADAMVDKAELLSNLGPLLARWLPPSR